MNARESQLHGRGRLARLKEYHEATAAEMEIERERFARLAEPGAAPRVVSAFNLFQTPPELARRLVGYFVNEPLNMLEPSAGLGRIYQAARERWPHCPITLIENSPQCCAELYRATEGDEAARLIQGDFLAQTTSGAGRFAAIAMNPPFCRGDDIKHVQHARRLLCPGGRLVAICAAGPKRRAAFADCSQWVDLPPGSFKTEGTRVETAIVIFDA